MIESKKEHNISKKSKHDELWQLVKSLDGDFILLPNNIVSIVQTALIDAKKLEDQKLLYLLNLRFGHYWLNKQNYAEAKKYTEWALQLAIKKEIEGGATNARINLGIICVCTNKLNDALYHLTQTLDKHETHQKIGIYTTLAAVYLKLKKYESALEYYEKSQDEVPSLTDIQSAALSINIGHVLYKLRRYEEALENIHIALELFNDSPLHRHEIATGMANIADIKLRLFNQG